MHIDTKPLLYEHLTIYSGFDSARTIPFKQWYVENLEIDLTTDSKNKLPQVIERIKKVSTCHIDFTFHGYFGRWGETLNTILPFQGLQNLVLYNLQDIAEFDANIPLKLCSLCSTITTLQLSSTTNSVVPVLKLLPYFPHVRTLDLQRLQITDVELKEILDRTPTLDCLILDSTIGLKEFAGSQYPNIRTFGILGDYVTNIFLVTIFKAFPNLAYLKTRSIHIANTTIDIDSQTLQHMPKTLSTWRQRPNKSVKFDYQAIVKKGFQATLLALENLIDYRFISSNERSIRSISDLAKGSVPNELIENLSNTFTNSLKISTEKGE